MPRDPELESMETAYNALRGIAPREWMRALNYLADRLAADDRTAHINKLSDRPAPNQFIIGGEIADPYENPDELVQDNADSFHPMEINGIAIVSQRFAVMVPIGTDDEIDGHEIMWFDTRDAADAYVSSAMAPSAD